MELAERLKTLRLEKHYTQQQIAEQLNLPYQNYQRWEKGRSNPKKSSLEKLAKVFNVPVSYLLCETNIRNLTDLEQRLEHLPEPYQKKVLDYVEELCKEYDKQQSQINSSNENKKRIT